MTFNSEHDQNDEKTFTEESDISFSKGESIVRDQ